MGGEVEVGRLAVAGNRRNKPTLPLPKVTLAEASAANPPGAKRISKNQLWVALRP